MAVVVAPESFVLLDPVMKEKAMVEAAAGTLVPLGAPCRFVSGPEQLTLAACTSL